MTKSKAALGAGNVEIELDGETVTLRPSLQAAQTISRQAGGISSALSAVGRFEFDTIVTVVTLGLGLTGNDAKEVPGRVYRTGLSDLIAPLSIYLANIANGGRPAAGGEEDQDPRSE
ncbi:hypothetical protein [Pseudaminobacter soli (ex Li et al. 2025)]|uniref:Phage tail assembly protein n=1 Tax=Pseudaminobacter soli (ex Li et al. 2025) TaxID=1295366 RepID=A0A2P7SE03_9HYPH|nr:hypothetical protein [Mesorhizobium soli]PSJ60744.1 hypothetical protein C7I85_11925 [Mesorhizobium soli]